MSDRPQRGDHQRDITGGAALENANNTPEDISNRARGYKAAISNPNVSDAAKDNARKELDALGGDAAFYSKAEREDKDPNRVQAGLKSTINQSKPEVSDEARQAAQEKLDKM
ncbi:hypothetical protein BDV95DRAFT_589337 [Massariosphaeria phaeospora]|uniref:Conidiation protein 6-domain-containing protein n=1 Tax=Massariosphaeria phaeospora TaxID=100035 RepID=A0A7C8MPI3_9PLEO|nr:hypothetical protein BDV95DRAFT_589337 [Massariosphaeria phaeospora]